MPVDAPPRTAPHRAPPRPVTGRIVYHPRYEHFLRRCGVTSAAAALDLAGEVVCGHPDRHVARVGLPSGRVVYVKREHVVGLRTRWRNARAGFGWVSRGEREAATLSALEAAGLPGPQWLSYGEAADGRAFLIVDELAGAADLRAILSDDGLSPSRRRTLAEDVGRAVGRLHAAGFGTPELAAKHVFVNPRSPDVTLIDWQSAGRPGPIPTTDRVRQLAGLHASLGPELASPRERLRFLRAYGRIVGAASGPLARAVMRAAGKVALRSTVRDQLRGPAPRLVWLDGEAVCAVPELAAVWPSPAAAAPFYADAPPGEEWVTFPDGLRARLARFRTTDPAGRLAAAVRERPWRSPAAKAARLLFHLHRSGIVAPKLLAFGQRATSPVAADSFVLFEPPPGAVPLTPAVTKWSADECGELVRRLHDTGCRIEPGERPVFVLSRGRVVVASPTAVRLAKHVGDRASKADLRALVRHDLAFLGRSDRARFVRGYLGPIADRSSRKLLLAALRSV